MTDKTSSTALPDVNPQHAAQMALYASRAIMVDEAWHVVHPKKTDAPTPFIDFDPQLLHVEQVTADLIAAKDEVLAGVRDLIWQQAFLAALPFEPFPSVLLAPRMTESERDTLQWS